MCVCACVCVRVCACACDMWGKFVVQYGAKSLDRFINKIEVPPLCACILHACVSVGRRCMVGRVCVWVGGWVGPISCICNVWAYYMCECACASMCFVPVYMY